MPIVKKTITGKLRAFFLLPLLLMTFAAGCRSAASPPTPIRLERTVQVSATRQPIRVDAATPTPPSGTSPAGQRWLPDLQPLSAENCLLLTPLETLAAYTSAIAVSPDGKWLASGSLERKLYIWGLTDGNLVQSFALDDNPGHIWAVQFSHDGRLLAMGSGDSNVRIWQLPEGTLRYTLQAHTSDIRSLAFAPDDRYLASGSNDQMIVVWDMADGTLVRMLGWNPGYVRAVSYSPDGDWLASAAGRGSLRFWDQRGVLMNDISIHEDDLTSLAFSPDGELLAVAARNRLVWLYQLPDFLRLTYVPAHEKESNSLVFSPDGQLLVSGSEDQTFAIWRVDAGAPQPLEEIHRLVMPENYRVSALQFSPDGRLLISASTNGNIILWGVPIK